jgi:hypothetical protein
LGCLSDFRDEARRVLRAAEDRGITLRLIGALAINLHCKKYAELRSILGREFSDIDFVAYSKDYEKIRRLFPELGYREEPMITVLVKNRLLYYDDANNRHSDVFLDQLEFCHNIPFKKRLEVDYPTLPLAELFLSKAQIVNINEKDLKDLIMMLREHEVGENDADTINAKRIAQLCADDWGLWKTSMLNFDKFKEYVSECQLTKEDKQDVISKINRIIEYIDKEPKSMRWKFRSKIGERKQWYKKVEEIGLEKYYEEKRLT